MLLASTVALFHAPLYWQLKQKKFFGLHVVLSIQNDLTKTGTTKRYTPYSMVTLSAIAEALGVDVTVLANI